MVFKGTYLNVMQRSVSHEMPMEYDWNSSIPVVANSSPLSQEMVRIANAKALHFAGVAYGASQVQSQACNSKETMPKDCHAKTDMELGALCSSSYTVSLQLHFGMEPKAWMTEALE